MVVVLAAIILDPNRPRIGFAAITLGHGPRTRQRVVDHRDFVVEGAGVGLVEENSLLDDGLIVPVQRNSAGVISAGRTVEAAGLDFKHVVAAIAVEVDPFTDRVAAQGAFDIRWPGAPVSEDSSRVQNVFDQDMRGLRRHHELRRAIGIGDTRHAGRQAGIGHAHTLSAGGLILEVGLENGLVFRRQGRFLSRPPGLALVKSEGSGGIATPLARQVGILRFIIRPSVGNGRQQRCGQRECTDRASVTHGRPPCGGHRRDGRCPCYRRSAQR